MTIHSSIKNRMVSYVSLIQGKMKRPETTLLLKNFSLTFVFKGLALLLLLIVNVVSVRELGVITWGQIALITSIANLVVIPLTLGVHNSVIKNVPIVSPEEGKQIMGTALLGNLIPSVTLTTLMIILSPWIELWFGLSSQHWIAAVAIAMSLNLYILTESFLRSQQQFFKMGVLKLIVTTVFLVGTLGAIYVLDIRSVYSYIIPTVIQHIVFFFIALKGSNITPLNVSLKVVKKLYHYGLFIMLSWFVSALLFSSDMFLVAYFSDEHSLGVYSIYQNSIRGLCTILFHDVFAVVFMPMIAAMDRKQLDHKIMKMFIPLFALIWLFAAVITVVLVWLYGKDVPLDLAFVTVTSAGIAMNIMYLLITTVIAMDSVKAAKWVFIALVAPVPLVILCQFIFIQIWGIIGGMFSVLVVNTLLIITVRLLIKYFYQFNSMDRKEQENV